jgi:hypothetical protein
VTLGKVLNKQEVWSRLHILKNKILLQIKTKVSLNIWVKNVAGTKTVNEKVVRHEHSWALKRKEGVNMAKAGDYGEGWEDMKSVR